MSKLALRVEGLSKSFAGQSIVSDLNFQIPAGAITGLVGFNGAGKSTTLKCLLGIVLPDRGSVYFFDTHPLAEVKKEIGYLPERPQLPEFLNSHEFLKHHWNLSLNSENFADNFEEAASVVLKKVGLCEVRFKSLRTFSKGMKQRIGIAQALLRKPKLLFLDEPFSGLDLEGRFFLRTLLKELKLAGVTIVFTSHSVSEMIELCDNILVLNKGRIAFKGALKDFLNLSNEAMAKALAEFYSIEAQFLQKLGLNE